MAHSPEISEAKFSYTSTCPRSARGSGGTKCNPEPVRRLMRADEEYYSFRDQSVQYIVVSGACAQGRLADASSLRSQAPAPLPRALNLFQTLKLLIWNFHLTTVMTMQYT